MRIPGTPAEAEAVLIREAGAAWCGLRPDSAEAVRWFRAVPEGRAALERLLRDGLLAAAPDGAVRPGPRSSGLSAERVRSLRTGTRYGSAVDVLAFTESTNDVALDRASAGAGAGVVVAAELQTAGRGRRGRGFDSRPGLGIWSTTLLDAPADPERAPRLSLIAGIALAEAVQALTGTAVLLKWPNDALVADRKIAGILVEARTVGDRVLPVAGIGINVHHLPSDFPGPLRGTAASVESASGVHVDRSELLAGLLGRLEVRLAEEARGSLDLPAVFAERDALCGAPVEADGPGGAVEGVADGIDATGALRIRTGSGGVVAVRGGEVSVRRRFPC